MRFPQFNSFSLRRPGRSGRSLGPLELDLLNRVWECGELSVREAHEAIGDCLAYTTVMTTLDRLYKKGLLNRRKDGRAFVYAAAITRERFCAITTRQAVASIFTFAHPSSDAVSYLVEAISESDARLLDDLERAVKERKRKEHRK